MKAKSLVKLAEECGKDQSYLRKLAKEHKLSTIDMKRKSDGKVVTALSGADVGKLLKKVPTLAVKPLGKLEIPLSAAAEQLAKDVSGLRKQLIAAGMKIFLRNKGEGRPTPCITESDLKKFIKVRNINTDIETIDE